MTAAELSMLIVALLLLGYLAFALLRGEKL